VFELPEWWSLIDRDAAIAEQFPPFEVVKRERPSGALAQRLNAEHEQRKLVTHARRERARQEQEADADALIERMEARTGEAARRRRLVEIQRETREAERRLSWLVKTANNIERKAS